MYNTNWLPEMSTRRVWQHVSRNKITGVCTYTKKYFPCSPFLVKNVRPANDTKIVNGYLTKSVASVMFEAQHRCGHITASRWKIIPNSPLLPGNCTMNHRLNQFYWNSPHSTLYKVRYSAVEHSITFHTITLSQHVKGSVYLGGVRSVLLFGSG